MANKSKRNALATMAGWRDFRGCTPLAGASSGFAIDRCNSILGNAGCLLSMLSAAAEDSGALLDKGDASQFDNRAGTIMAGALDAIGTLIDVAAFMLDDGE